MSNILALRPSAQVLRHERSFQFHAAALHVLGLACQRSVMAGRLRCDEAFHLQRIARNRLDTGQLRMLIAHVLVDTPKAIEHGT